MSNKDVKAIHLDCNHEIWFSKPFPEPGEEIYCIRCDRYETVSMASVRDISIIHDGWVSSPATRGWIVAQCIYKEDCTYTTRAKSWHQLEKRMWSHHYSTHGYGRHFPKTINIKEGPPVGTVLDF